MKTFLIAGGIGSGKSAVSAYLAGKGVPVYDSDSRARQLYYDDEVLADKIERQFGICLFSPDGSLDKKTLARVIFSDASQLARLEAIVHPAVLWDFNRWRAVQNQTWCGYAGAEPFVCMESAIALDKPLFDGVYDRVIWVDAPEELRLERASRRDVSTRDKIKERMDHQQDHSDRADVILLNDGDLETLYRRTDAAFRQMLHPDGCGAE